ncbi:hypothetical protein [Baekduia alba]|uniref:hypothetical protein n=1 Tax=Baekduia alba TaxID=2997333 RepID=UPI0023416437|nr:hypothetical protein [Baekduia alba]
MTRWRCCSCWLAVVVACAGLASPAHAATGTAATSSAPASTSVPASTAVPAPTETSDDAYSDPSRSLGATSPSCRYGLSAAARRSCRASGSVAEPHPLSSYGIDVRVGFSITDPGRSFLGALQTLGAGLWMALLYIVKGVLLLLEWAFSLDLTNEAMPQLRTTLARLHDQAFGDWWLLLGISLTGVWGIHRGLVQRRTTETIAGLAATVALMVGGLLIISRPDDTVGWAARATNDAGMAVLAAGTGSRADDPRDALANSLRQVFDTTVRKPWCALEFGSLDYCDARTGDPSRATNAELWLNYPAQGWQRGRLHKLMKGDDGGGGLPDPLTAAKDVLGIGGDRKLPDDVESLVHKDSDRASIQEAGGTFPRLALLVIILVGLTGAIALYAYLGVRLVLAAGLGLVLLFIAPAMLIAPALGDGGRATFIAWIKRLLGAEVAKFVFAIFLTVVLVASRVFGGLELGWFGTWLLEAAFWWGIFIKRHEILDFVSGGLPQQHGDGIGHVLSHGYYAWMLGRGARQMASRATAPAGAGAEAVRTSRQEHQEARSAATRSLAAERLDQRHREEIVSGQDQARGVVAQREVLQRELRATDRRLAGHDEATAVANATKSKPPAPNPEQRQLIAHRQHLRGMLADPAATEAEQTVRHADRNRALTGDSVTRTDLDVHRARRAEELRGADTEGTAEERDLLAAAQARPGDRTADERARRWLDDDELQQRRAQSLAELRAERRQRRAGQGRRRR